MKKIVRISLWLMIVAWNLFLNDYEVLGITVAILCSLYIYRFNNHINHWRLISIYLITSSLSCLILKLSSLDATYHLIIPFQLVMNLNTSLVNESFYKLCISNLKSFYFWIATTTFIFLGFSLLIPDCPFLPEYKTNLLIYDSLIFFPSFLETSVALLVKLFVCHKKSEKLYNKVS